MATFLTPDAVFELNGVTVKQYLLTKTKNNTNKIALPPRRQGAMIGPTIHNTNAINQAKGTTMSEQYTRATRNGAMGTVVVHFYVDEVEAWQLLPLDWSGWHAGQKGKLDANGSEKGNGNTISIEVIGNSKKAEENAARLAAAILDLYHLTIDDVYTHNYWCNVRNGKKGTTEQLNKLDDGYKGCPIYIRPHWDSFLKSIESFREKKAEEVPVDKKSLYYVQVGAFSSKINAEKYLNEVKKKYPDAFIKRFDT